MSNRDNGFGSFLIGLFAGAVVGVITTILYAPKSGEETRSGIREKKDVILDKANLSVDEAYKQAEIAVKEARSRLELLADQAKVKSDDFTRRSQVILEERFGRFSKEEETAEEIQAPSE